MGKLQQGTEKKAKNVVVDTSLSPVVRAAEGAVLEPRRQEHKQKTQVSFYHTVTEQQHHTGCHWEQSSTSWAWRPAQTGAPRSPQSPGSPGTHLAPGASRAGAQDNEDLKFSSCLRVILAWWRRDFGCIPKCGSSRHTLQLSCPAHPAHTALHSNAWSQEFKQELPKTTWERGPSQAGKKQAQGFLSPPVLNYPQSYYNGKNF